MSGITLPPLAFSRGDTIRQHGAGGRGFTYELVATEPYTRPSGTASAVLTWRGRCAVCSVPFDVSSGRKPHRYLVRTCAAHRGAKPVTWSAVTP